MPKPTLDSLQPFKRLFFALDCPAPQRKAIAGWRRELGLRGGKPVPTENFHVTLLFLGDVPTGQVGLVKDAASKVQVPEGPVPLLLDHLDVWRRSQVLVLGADHPPPELLRLVYDLEQAMLPLGLSPARTPDTAYRPHLTLVRDFRQNVPEAPQPIDFRLDAWEFVLYESRKGSYEELGRWPIAPPAPPRLAPHQPMRHPFTD